MALKRDSIATYIESTFGVDKAELGDDTPLFSSGLLDSFSVADLLMFLEDAGNFVVEPEEVVPENLDSIGKIVEFSARKSK